MVKLVATGAAAFFAMASPALAAKPKLTVTWPAAASSGQVTVITAKLSPARSGVKLSLQRQVSGKWTTLASAKTNKKGIATMTARLAAGAAQLRVSGKAGKRSVSSPVKALAVADGGSDGGGGTGGGGSGGGSGPLFTPPGRDLSGQEAADRIVPYLENASFTDCVPGWPSCAVETRYGFFSNATMFYCRLTNSSGSDIINAGHPFQIIGAEMKANGAWGVSLQVQSYASTVYYNWEVSTTGVVYGAYWGPGADPRSQPATQSIGPLQWVRGARNCSY
ncbi:MAG: hypothetical protein KGR19_09110 [Acidobacteria bacterium]|nr:hypothetical protein [Acidobacteriota bacterium]